MIFTTFTSLTPNAGAATLAMIFCEIHAKELGGDNTLLIVQNKQKYEHLSKLSLPYKVYSFDEIGNLFMDAKNSAAVFILDKISNENDKIYKLALSSGRNYLLVRPHYDAIRRISLLEKHENFDFNIIANQILSNRESHLRLLSDLGVSKFIKNREIAESIIYGNSLLTSKRSSSNSFKKEVSDIFELDI